MLGLKPKVIPATKAVSVRLPIADYERLEAAAKEHKLKPAEAAAQLLLNAMHPNEKTGTGSGRGFTYNVPLSAGQDEAAYLRIVEGALYDRLAEFSPDLLLISAGFDAHRDDPLGHMEISSAGFGALTRWAHQTANELTGGKIISFLEGGYHLEALSASVANHLAELAEPPISD